MVLTSVKELITASDVQGSMDAEIIRSMTDDAGSMLAHAVSNACVWAFAIMKRCDTTGLDTDDQEIIKLALIKRAQYELFSMSEVEETANDKKEQSENLMIGLFGERARLDQAEINEESAVVAVSVSHDRKLSQQINPAGVHWA